MRNCQYFNYSKNNPEELFDAFYKKGVLVLPKDSSIDNALTKNNKLLIDNITAFKVLFSQGYKISDKPLIDIVNNVVNILSTTKLINYSAFSQFFMVYNTTYGYFIKLDKDSKFNFVYLMLIKYCEERHNLYLEHGYTNSILQVMSDNYSHKRNSKTSIEKIISILKPYGLKKINNINQIDENNIYFLPDKGDNDLFEKFLIKFKLKMESRKIEQNKVPDMVFKFKEEFFICELKTMKGSGGGQNKQIVEIIYFVRFSEDSPRFHYLSFLDGDYSNILFNSKMRKICAQREDIEKVLKDNPGNYFVNTAGFKKLISDLNRD